MFSIFPQKHPQVLEGGGNGSGSALVLDMADSFKKHPERLRRSLLLPAGFVELGRTVRDDCFRIARDPGGIRVKRRPCYAAGQFYV